MMENKQCVSMVIPKLLVQLLFTLIGLVLLTACTSAIGSIETVNRSWRRAIPIIDTGVYKFER